MRVSIWKALWVLVGCLLFIIQSGYAIERKPLQQLQPQVQQRIPTAGKVLLTDIKAVLSAATPVYRGNCPAGVRFNGSITVNRAMTVKYIFTRNDGATDTITKTLVFKGPGKQYVKDTWTLGGTGLPYYKGWKAIKVLSPKEVTSNQAVFELRCNPPLNSAISAHGNTDWHIDTANEFLFGVDMHGVTTASNHAPDGWSKRHMHVNLSNTSKYYYDKMKTPVGDDTNATSGIDKAMLFFYAGHGSPTGWSSLGDGASQGNMILGNVAQGGQLRYYWQCSCEVFAHGPKTCAGATWEYACPQNFTGGTDSVNVRNVFERWGPALRSDLRMACGMSTAAYCHEGNVNKVWDNYNNGGMSVADSFIDGFSGGGVVPLCITMGGPNILTTPLYDARFTNQPNTSGSTYYHILYASGTGRAANPDITLIPKLLPRIKLVPSEIHPILRQQIAPIASFAGGRAQVRIEPLSGAVHLKAVREALPTEPSIQERDYLTRSSNLIRQMNWEDPDLGEPEIMRVMAASMPVGGNASQIRQMQKSVKVSYRRRIQVDGKRINVLGGGGLINVELSNSGSVLNATRVWRKLDRTQAMVQIKSYNEALSEAMSKLGRTAKAYKLDHWDWGYQEPSGNVRQDEMKIIFQFAFVPINRNDMFNNPPRMVVIPGEKK